MKTLKRLIVYSLALAMILSMFAVSTSAGSISGQLKYVEDKGLVVALNSNVSESDITAVKLDSTTLQKGTDYLVDDSGNTTIIFTQSFMENALVKDIKKIEVYCGGEKCSLNSGSYFDTVVADGEFYLEAMTRADFDNTSEGRYYQEVLDFFVEKGVLTASQNGDTTTYKNGNLEVFYVDDEFAYPAEVNYFDNLYTIDLTFAEGYDFFSQGMRYAEKSAIIVAFGNRLVMDWSSFEPGVETQIGYDYNTRMFMYFYICGLMGEDLITCDWDTFEQTSEVDIYSVATGKKLFHFKIVEENVELFVTVEPGLTVEDNVYYKYINELIDGQRDGDYGMLSIVFENPKIKMGDKSTWDTEKKGDLSISSYAEIDDYLCMYVDGGQIPKDAYTVTEGSTVITLKESFLESIEDGNHTLEIVSLTGSAIADFSTMVKEESKSNAKTEEKKNEVEEIANTSDDSNLGIFVALCAISSASVVTVIKKKQGDKND